MITRILAIVALAFTLVACSASNKGQLEMTEDGQVITKVYSNNSLLASRISVPELKQAYRGDLMYVQATLENDWKFKLDFQYKLKWFNADGFEINPEGQPWQQVVMAGRSQNNVQGIAPNPTPTRFEIWVQE